LLFVPTEEKLGRLNYSEAIQFLYDLRLFGVKFGLEKTRRLAALAGHPEEKLRFIHVAGTNGKGSTCAMLESIYRAAGLRVGLFTSPHLVSFVERIQVNRKPISPADVTRLVDEIKAYPVFSDNQEAPTFFEVVTVMALKYFAEQHCDLVIWETGLGGRLDATNIVRPLASVITNVQFDHQQWLGQTLPEIAREKAGIIKSGAPIITTAEAPEALQGISETAHELDAPLSVVTEKLDHYEIGLAGEHQRLNAALAVKVVEVLRPQIAVTEANIRNGLKEAHWDGRLQTVRGKSGQTILLDGAHNPAGVRTLLAAAPNRFSLILGMMRDKECAAICKMISPAAEKIFTVPMNTDRGADPGLLADYCREANPTAPVAICRSITEAFDKAAAEPFVVVTGSLYLVGEALEHLGLAEPSSERCLNENASGSSPDSIRAVTFDVGGTLIEPWPSVGHVYARVAERAGFHVSPEILNEQFATAWKKRQHFGYSLSDWQDLVHQTFAGLVPASAVTAFFSELYHEFTQPEAWKVYDDVRPCLERLRREGCKLAVISNWDERLRPLLKALHLDQFFDLIVVSSEIGRHKPEPGIFREAANQLLTAPQSIMHVGDSLREDYEGARAAGFHAVLLTRHSRPPSSCESVSSLGDLKIAK
jgi:dihydrofolate synthase/folylpolyglutamate synthase